MERKCYGCGTAMDLLGVYNIECFSGYAHKFICPKCGAIGYRLANSSAIEKDKKEEATIE